MVTLFTGSNFLSFKDGAAATRTIFRIILILDDARVNELVVDVRRARVRPVLFNIALLAVQAAVHAIIGRE